MGNLKGKQLGEVLALSGLKKPGLARFGKAECSPRNAFFGALGTAESQGRRDLPPYRREY